MTTEPTSPRRELPGGSFLAYIVGAESYYYRAAMKDDPYISIGATNDGDGPSWEFSVVDHSERLNAPTALRVEIFDDAWRAFSDVPELFAAMAAGEIESLDDLRALLDRLGAVDQTTRDNPYRHQPDPDVDLGAAAKALRDAGVTPGAFAQMTDQPYRTRQV